MNPIYKYELSANGTTQRAFPNHSNDTGIDYELENGQQFYRGKLSGKLTFQADDYAFIKAKAFDTRFTLTIYISYDAGATWAAYWTGQFWKTDCEFNEDSETATVTPEVTDAYNAILAGLDKEYNLIDLAPAIQPVKADKRPMIQVYVPGQTVVGCFLSGMWWEQECEAIEENDLSQFDFAFNKGARQIDVTQTGYPELPPCFYGDMPDDVSTNYEFAKETWKVRYTYERMNPVVKMTWEIIRDIFGTQTVYWSYVYQGTNPPHDYPLTITLQPVSGTQAQGTVELYIHDIKVYARLITDRKTASSYTADDIPGNDMVADNRNYHYMIGYNFPDIVGFSDTLSTTPTKWGLYEPGYYYHQPSTAIVPEWFPVCRSAWGRLSIWFAPTAGDATFEQLWRSEFTLKDAYPLWSVLSVLLGEVAPNITHAGTTAYSRFLYGQNPISGINQTLLITPKSNVIASGYDQPAQKAPITLGQVLNMLRDCFRCYWFVDSSNRLRIEHIDYFRRGGDYYPAQPVVGVNLTQRIVTRNGKTWAFARNQYQYDKPEMPARYQFGWMDDVTELFEGYPIEITSNFVNADNIEQVDVSQFTSDIDYILLNPNEISKDGFVLLAAQLVSGEYKLPYMGFVVGEAVHTLQNPWVSFAYLQRYYMYDMPAPGVTINGVTQTVHGVKKLKTQTIKFPLLANVDLMKLVKTELGDGVIQKLSLNLSSRGANATLRYDTE